QRQRCKICIVACAKGKLIGGRVCTSLDDPVSGSICICIILAEFITCKLEVLEANESINVWIMQARAELINRHRLWNERLIEWSLHNVLIVQVVRKQSYSPATWLQSAAELNHTAIFTEIQSLCLHKD